MNILMIMFIVMKVFYIQLDILLNVKNNAFTSINEQGLFPFGKWHNLRKDPNDLPLVHSTVLDENGDKVEYIEYGKWQAYSEYYERYYEVDPPIAWCEIPKFEE